ncbi:unnamed protein product [Symbiodinium natans]|uniref:Uncharacterized protein n=1 Tax=Symbiodinium natans TaxID=878477 RepID=A0A812KPJ6_9DINO|nr:unnamed protein product [Symbiodinium natans]
MATQIPLSWRAGGSAEADVWLVWCFEHCLKPERSDVREDLKHLATTAGCKFVCHKKSMNFFGWLDGRKGTKLIIADWREAKPIIEELSRHKHRSDVRMCVVARSEKMFRRASVFVEKQTMGAEIMVTSDFSRDSVEEFVLTCVRTCKTSPCKEVRPKPTEMLRWLSLPHLLEAVQDPKTAASLEDLLQQTMQQVYED